MNGFENIAWRSNQGQVSNSYHQVPFTSPFKGSVARNNPSTGATAQGVFSFGSSAGNFNQITNESQNPTSSVLNYDKTDYNAPGQFTSSFHSLPNFENAATSSKSSGKATQNLNSVNDSTSAMGTGEMNIVSVPGIDSKIPQKRAPMNSHSKGSGINFGGRDKERKSPLRPRVENKVIAKKKVASERSRLAEALDHLESIGELLEPHNHLLAIVTHLEGSIIKHMTCKTRSKAGLGSWDVDSAYQSMSRSSATEETDSVAASFDLTLDSHSCSSKAPGDDSQSDQMDIATEMETPRATKLQTIVYHCVFQKPGKTCNYSTTRKGDWIRHGESEDHFPQKRYMCISCMPSLGEDNGNPICVFCYTPISVLGNNKLHYLQCQKAQKAKHVFAGAREEHFKSHLRKQHGLTRIGIEQSSWTFDVQSDWPSECGFCGERFSSFQARTNHIAAHFQEGADISSWRLPFGKAKEPHDHRPGVDYQRWNDDDNDDDDGDNGFGGGGKSLDLHFFLDSSSGSSGSGSGRTSSSTGYDPQDWSSAIFDGNIFQMGSRGYDSKLKVEVYLKHQLLSDRPSDFEDDSQTSDTRSDTPSELVDTPLKHSPAKESGKAAAHADEESNVEQDNIDYCQAESETSDANIDHQPRMKHNPNKEKQPFHFDISSIDFNVARNKVAARPRRERKYTPTRRKEVALDPENADSLAPDADCNLNPRARKRATPVSSDTEVASDFGSCKRICISPSRPTTPFINLTKIIAAHQGKLCPQTCSDQNILSRSVLKKRIKPFQCVFTFSGCHSAFSTKNEWKRHVFTQHMNLQTIHLCQSYPPPFRLQRALQGSSATFGKKVGLNKPYWNRVENVIEELAEDGQVFGPFGVQELAGFRPDVPAFIATDDSLKLQDTGMRNLSTLRSSHLETPPGNPGGKPSQMSSGLDQFLPSPATISFDMVMSLTKYTTGYFERPFLQWVKFTRQDQSRLPEDIMHQHLVSFMTKTGSGKSTLVKMLIKNEESAFETTKNEHAFSYLIGERYSKISANNRHSNTLLHLIFNGGYAYHDWPYSNWGHEPCRNRTFKNSTCEPYPGRHDSAIEAASDSACQGDFVSKNSNRHYAGDFGYKLTKSSLICQHNHSFLLITDKEERTSQKHQLYPSQLDYEGESTIHVVWFFAEDFFRDFAWLRHNHSYHYLQCLDKQHVPNNAHEPTYLPGTDDQGWPNHGRLPQWWKFCHCYLSTKNYHCETGNLWSRYECPNCPIFDHGQCPIERHEPKNQTKKMKQMIILRTMIKFNQADLLDVGSGQCDLGPDGLYSEEIFFAVQDGDHGEPRWYPFGPAIGPGYPNCPSCYHRQCPSKQHEPKNQTTKIILAPMIKIGRIELLDGGIIADVIWVLAFFF